MKKIHRDIIKISWDSKVFGINTYEILALSRSVLKQAGKLGGHFTIRIDPLSSKKLLHEYGFYYCDTLIKPYCEQDSFIYFENEKAGISHKADINDLVRISHGAFYGRFHRDFNIDNRLADLRYDMWLKNLNKQGKVFGLIFDGKMVGFFGFSGNKIVLHAIDKKYRGKGLAKYLWSAACNELFRRGHNELVSSISLSNIPSLNLYASLGFKFRNSCDIYHALF